MNNTSTEINKSFLYFSIAVTLLYWYWESIASGNIRVDLLVIYPVLFTLYCVTMWEKYRYYSIFFSMVIMVINVMVFMISYDLFDKNPG